MADPLTAFPVEFPTRSQDELANTPVVSAIARSLAMRAVAQSSIARIAAWLCVSDDSLPELTNAQAAIARIVELRAAGKNNSHFSCSRRCSNCRC